MKTTTQEDDKTMKKWVKSKIALALCVAAVLFLAPVMQTKVYAAETVVQGTVASGTTSSLLLLTTKDGKMEIKMDGTTDVSEARILLPGTKLSVTISYGPDAYWHAVKLSNNGQTNTVTVDNGKTSTVTGTINEKTTGDVLHVDTPQGEMEIKYDGTTNIQCSVLVANKNYTISCARGSDAYMHALTISDAPTQSSTTANTQVTTSSGNTATNNFIGTIASNTTESVLYLSTKDGVMEFRIDSDADTSNGFVNVSGNRMTVGAYQGSDGYWHAVSTIGDKESSSANINTDSTITVSGTISSKSTEKKLYLDTNGGTMELKLDAVRSRNNFKVLTVGKKVTVTCGYGSDEYWHALDITK